MSGSLWRGIYGIGWWRGPSGHVNVQAVWSDQRGPRCSLIEHRGSAQPMQVQDPPPILVNRPAGCTHGTRLQPHVAAGDAAYYLGRVLTGCT